ncbi:MAG: hypothetical protein WBB19_10285 [Desulforhopalus sp.]
MKSQYGILFSLLGILLMSGCGISSSIKIANVTGDRYVGRDLAATLSELDQKGIYCSRSSREESDERLKALTDGSLDEVRFYQCITESDSIVGVSRNVTYMVAQHGKVLRINGNVPASSYIWQ